MELNEIKLLKFNLWDILKTKKIDVNFAIKYILFSKYNKTESEKCINRDDVLFLQPHISIKELDDAIAHFRENLDKISN
jgi:hypothetical protein